MKRRTFLKGGIITAISVVTSPFIAPFQFIKKILWIDNSVRKELANIINQALFQMKEKGSIYNYLVVCDETNNGSEQINRQELRADIYIEQIVPVETIQMNFVIGDR